MLKRCTIGRFKVPDMREMRSLIVNLDRNDTSPNAAGTKKMILAKPGCG